MGHQLKMVVNFFLSCLLHMLVVLVYTKLENKGNLSEDVLQTDRKPAKSLEI